MLGGIIADKLGEMKTVMITLSLSLVLFIFSFNNIICAFLATLLFNMTMSLTLTILSNNMSSSKGTAFGLTTFSLFIGALPVILGYDFNMFNEIGLAVLVSISIVLMYVGIKKNNKDVHIW